MADARLVQLNDTYIVNVTQIREVIFEPSDGTEPAKTRVYTIGSDDPVECYDDEAITAWHRLLDLCDGGPHDRHNRH